MQVRDMASTSYRNDGCGFSHANFKFCLIYFSPLQVKLSIIHVVLFSTTRTEK